jgi:hypothetical protein
VGAPIRFFCQGIFMVELQRFQVRLLCTATVLFLVVTAPLVRAQDDDAPEVNARERPHNVFKDESQFNNWLNQAVFSSSEGNPAARARLEKLLSLRLERVERTCGITEPQRKKLQLAGRCDIKRLLDRVDEIRRRFPIISTDQDEFNRLQFEIQPLGSSFGMKLFEEGSFFSKTQMKTLTVAQAAKLETAVRESRLFRHRAKVDLAVQFLDLTVGLCDLQRQALTRMLLEHTQPSSKAVEADMEVEFVLAQASRMAEARIRPICDDAQWKTLRGVFKHIDEGVNQGLGAFLQDLQVQSVEEPAVSAVVKPE